MLRWKSAAETLSMTTALFSCILCKICVVHDFVQRRLSAFFGEFGIAPHAARDGTALATQEASQLDEGPMQIGVESSRAVENKRIFVVDENEIFRAAVQFMLHDENETHEVASLEAAFAKAQTAKPD